ncbi:MAG TPA: GAP family protein [Gaiellaceae bacterium]|jgi:threonine/homoserine/homoserine lactone efflux protein
MGHALGNVLPLAIAVAVFPVPIIAAVLVVGSDRGRVKGAAFVLAWCAGLAIVGALVLVLGGVADASEGGEPASWVSWLLLGLGLLCLAGAVKQLRSRPGPGEETPVPGWMRRMDDLTIAKAAAAGFALTALNPKNVLLTVAAGAEIAEGGIPASQEVMVMAVFVLLASAGVLTPLVLALALGDRSRDLLDGLRGWMARYNATIMAVLFMLIGVKLIGDAVSGLSG